MRESQGERWSVASLPCIFASPQHSSSCASTLLFWTSEQFFFSCICSARTDQSSRSTNQWTVCLQWILLRQAVKEHKVSLLSVSLWNRQSRRMTGKLCSLAQFYFCSHAWLCAEMPEVSYFISVSWMFIQVRRSEGWDGWEGARLLEAHMLLVSWMSVKKWRTGGWDETVDFHWQPRHLWLHL